MKEDKKGKIRGLKGSLASRILLIALIFLVLPLLFLSFLLYKEDRRVKSYNNFFTLNVLMKKKVEIFEAIISHERDFLSGIGFLLQKIENSQNLLNELSKREGVSALFHIKMEYGGYYICDMSSDLKYQGKNFTSLIEESQKGVYLVLNPKDLTFFLTRVSNDGNEAWITVLSFNRFIESFPVEKEILYPSATALLASDGSVITSTDPRLKGKRFVDSQGEILFYEGEAPHFFFEGERHIAIKRQIPQTNFSLLISAPQKINFIDIPYFLLKIGVILGLIILIGGGGGIWLTIRLSRPLKNFIHVMSKVGRGDLSARFVYDMMGFEFNVIGEIFNETVQSLTHHMEKAEQERVEKETYARELKIGEEVQNSILPKELPKFPNLEIAARFIAAKEVGGDFYDFLPRDKLMLSIADTAGKGISACLYSLSVRSMLRSYGIIHQELDVIVHETNELFCLDTKDTGVFVTAFIAFFDPVSKELHYTNCGHFPAFLLRECGAIEKLTTEGMALGVTSFEHVITQRVMLERGDLLVFFTDGVVEAHNSKQELFGEKRFIEFLELKKAQSPQQIVDDLIEEVGMFAEGTPQHDDITIVVMRIL